MNKRTLGLLFSVVFMDMVGFGFIIPILPDFVFQLGGSQAVFGLILSSYALGQFFAAPIVGRLSDRYGRKPLFLFSIFGTFVSLLVLGSAKTVAVVFVSRIVDGLTGGNITVAQSYISDVTSKEDRSRGLGLIGAAFGLGFIVGPLFGGILVQYGLAVPAYVAAGIAACNLVLIGAVLPESLPKEKRLRSGSKSSRRFSVGLLLDSMRTSRAAPFLIMILFYSLAFTMFETMFSPHAAASADLSPRTRSFVLAYVGVLVAITQGGGIGFLVKRIGEKRLLNVSAIVMAAVLPLWGFSDSLPALVAILFPLSIAGGIVSVILKSLVSKSVTQDEIGTALGASNSIESVNRIVAPLLGGLLLGQVALWAPGVLGGVLASVVFLLLLLGGNRRINAIGE